MIDELVRRGARVELRDFHMISFAVRLAAVALLGAFICSAYAQPAAQACSTSEQTGLTHLGEIQADPAKLLRVREDRPEHYRKIVAVAEELLSAMPAFDRRAVERAHGVKNICTEQLMSNPPKIGLTLTIEEMRYRVILSAVAPPPPQ